MFSSRGVTIFVLQINTFITASPVCMYTVCDARQLFELPPHTIRRESLLPCSSTPSQSAQGYFFTLPYIDFSCEHTATHPGHHQEAQNSRGHHKLQFVWAFVHSFLVTPANPCHVLNTSLLSGGPFPSLALPNSCSVLITHAVWTRIPAKRV
ncbi:hypothetical protein EDB19DRAFT_1700898 [Suillus lakei]|nr:hypothetical protein EDB19DRAFT_1700898 [Suillus lakei]